MADAAELFERGLALHSRGHVAEAELTYLAVLQADPDHLSSLLSLALMFAEQRRRDEAQALLELAMKRAPRSAPAKSCLGDVLVALDRYDEAVSFYEAALQIQPSYVEAHCGLAKALNSQKRLDEAAAAYEHALELRPAFPEAHNDLGNVLLSLHRYGEAAAHYHAALALRPDFAEACGNLGNALQALGRHEESLAWYGRALDLRPAYPEAYNNLGNALQALRRYEEAIPCYRQALALRAEFAEAHNNLGTALRALELYDQALAEFEKAARLRPGYADAHDNLGNVMAALHRHAEAAQHYRRALDIDPESAVAHSNLGSALDELQQTDEALLHHETAVRQAPENKLIQQAAAIFFLKHGDVRAASRHGIAGFGTGIETQPHRGPGQPVSVLVLQSTLGGNVRVETWLDEQTFRKSTVSMEFWTGEGELPPHQLAINAIGEADRCTAGLQAARKLLEGVEAPVINDPARVMATGRLENARRLAELPDVVSPSIRRWPRDFLVRQEAPAGIAAGGFSFPLLVRAPGFHTGEHFFRVDEPAGLAEAAGKLPAGDAFVIQFVDLADTEGKFRKFRVMTIDGQLYPLHLAIATRWMVHFMTADMALAEHRAEDERFLDDMPGFLGRRAMAALERIRDLLGLDYGGVDFSLDAGGRLVVWEANATMVAPLPDRTDERWAYRLPALERVHAAVRDMILARAGVAVA